jgi:hypothetical protein
MPFLVAGDRMIAIFAPLYYRKLGAQFAAKVLIFPIAFSFATLAYFILRLHNSTVMVGRKNFQLENKLLETGNMNLIDRWPTLFT